MIHGNVKFPDSQKWINFVLNKILDRNFHQNKETFDIDVASIKQFFTELLKQHGCNADVIGAWIHCMLPEAPPDIVHLHQQHAIVYYLQFPDNSGNLLIPDRGIDFKPITNDFVIIRKGLKHHNSGNKSDGVRLVMVVFFNENNTFKSNGKYYKTQYQ